MISRRRGGILQAREPPRRAAMSSGCTFWPPGGGPILMARSVLRAGAERLTERLPPRTLADICGLPRKATACLSWRRAGPGEGFGSLGVKGSRVQIPPSRPRSSRSEATLPARQGGLKIFRPHLDRRFVRHSAACRVHQMWQTSHPGRVAVNSLQSRVGTLPQHAPPHSHRGGQRFESLSSTQNRSSQGRKSLLTRRRGRPHGGLSDRSAILSLCLKLGSIMRRPPWIHRACSTR